MTKNYVNQRDGCVSEVLIFDPDVNHVDSLVGSVGSHIKVITAQRGGKLSNPANAELRGLNDSSLGTGSQAKLSWQDMCWMKMPGKA